MVQTGSIPVGLVRYRSFHISYLSATNHRPSRIKIRDCWYKQTIIIPMNYDYDNILETAQEKLTLLGFDIVAMATANSSDRGYDLLLCENFELRLK